VDLRQLVDEVVAEIGQDTKGRDIAWKIGALPVCYGDRSMLRLVVVNLVFERGQIHFACESRPKSRSAVTTAIKKEVEVFVRDNGRGF